MVRLFARSFRVVLLCFIASQSCFSLSARVTHEYVLPGEVIELTDSNQHVLTSQIKPFLREGRILVFGALQALRWEQVLGDGMGPLVFLEDFLTKKSINYSESEVVGVAYADAQHTPTIFTPVDESDLHALWVDLDYDIMIADWSTVVVSTNRLQAVYMAAQVAHEDTLLVIMGCDERASRNLGNTILSTAEPVVLVNTAGVRACLFAPAKLRSGSIDEVIARNKLRALPFAADPSEKANRRVTTTTHAIVRNQSTNTQMQEQAMAKATQPSPDSSQDFPRSFRALPTSGSRNDISHQGTVYASLEMYLETIPLQNSVVFFTAGTHGYAPMMNSFYVTSAQRFGLDLLLVALSPDMCARSLHSEASCVQLGSERQGGEYGSKGFAEAAGAKILVLEKILSHGHIAWLADSDIHFFHNPLPLLLKTPGDLAMQDDDLGGRNSGFMFVRPTEMSKKLVRQSVVALAADPKRIDQDIINAILKKMGKSLNLYVLDPKTWPCGKVFFGRNTPIRMFAWQMPCTQCVIMHNNWIAGAAGKELRARELLGFGYDVTSDSYGGYYGSATRKYLVVGNPDPGVVEDVELGALKAAFAFGWALNRTVILPFFRCRSSQHSACTLNARYNVASWVKHLPQWRESMFRYNPLTHADIRLRHNLRAFTEWAHPLQDRPELYDAILDTKGPFSLESPHEPAHFIPTTSQPRPRFWGNVVNDEAPVASTQVHTTSRVGFVTLEESLALFGQVADRVLRFHSLYGVTVQGVSRIDDQWAKVDKRHTRLTQN